MDTIRRCEVLDGRKTRRILKLLAEGKSAKEIGADGRVKLTRRAVQLRKKRLREAYEFLATRVQ
jgi:DNA-binding NarL/FixJ family response regulator